jgi:glycosyltransferase involved in cell wall biosynthesis
VRILILSDHFYPDLSSGGRLWTELSAALVEQGEIVSVLTAFSAYNSEVVSGTRDVYRGINIRRVASTRFARKNLVGRLVNEFSFCISVFFRALVQPKPDVILTLSSPPFLPFFVAFLSKFRRVPFVYVMYDVFPDIAVQTGLLESGAPIVKFWERISRLTLRNATRIVVIGKCMQDVIEAKLGSAKVPVDTIHNWSDSRQLYPILRSENPFFERYPELRDKFIVQYSGNLGRFQDFETILAVAEQLSVHTEIHFLIIGDGFRRQWLTDEVEKKRLANVSLLPFQPQAELIYSLNAADVSLVTLERGAEGLGVPSKFYPILAVGKPVVAVMHPSAEVARTVQEAQVGEVVQQGDVRGLSAVVRRLACDRAATERMGARSLELFLREFDLPIAVQHYQRTLERAAKA